MHDATGNSGWSTFTSAIGLKRLSYSTVASVSAYLVVVGTIVWFGFKGSEAMGYNWQWNRAIQYVYRLTDEGFQFGEIIHGLTATILLSITAFALAGFIGLAVALLRLSNLLTGRGLSRAYLEVVRNTPLLVLLYVYYYVFGPIFNLDRYLASILCLASFHGALISEIVRAGLLAAPKGQWEAANSLGMGKFLSYRLIIIPQSIRLMLPPLTNEGINLIKNSAIVSVIAVAELTTVGRNIISDTYMSFEIWFIVAVVYLIVTLCLSVFASRLEAKFAVKN